MLQINNVSKSYQKKSWLRKKETIQAVKSVSLQVKEGTCLAVVGKSGSGKTTLGRLLLGIETPDAGEIFFQSNNVHTAGAAVQKQLKKDMQIVFQNCHGAVNPRMKIRDIIAEPIQVHKKLDKKELKQKVEKLLLQVGLKKEDAVKYPHQLSGGQLQRITIARAISTDPKLIVLDESINSLDLLVQVSILKLLKQLQKTHGFSYFFITHDLHAVKLFADEVAVMDEGKIVEHITDMKNLDSMTHPASRRLLSARLSIAQRMPAPKKENVS